jgi:quercetin dioxygenase-like cupin family protein
MLSDIERGKVNPSVATMFRVASALGVPPHTFFPAPSEAPENESSRGKSRRVVLRPSQRPELPLTGGITWQRLTPRSEGPVEFIEMRYEPGAASGDAPHHHPGREMGLVLEGELTLELGPAQYVLRAGDSIAFDSTTPHRLANRGPDVLRLAWVNVHCRT